MIELTEVQKAAVDSLYHTPQERAQAIYLLLTKKIEEMRKQGIRPLPTETDIGFFAVEYLATLALAFGDEEFTYLSQCLIRWLRTYHYNAPEKVHGKPDKLQS